MARSARAGPIDVRGEIGVAYVGERGGESAMIFVTAQGAGGAMWAVKFRTRPAVVDGEDVAGGQLVRHGFDPVEGGEVRFGFVASWQ